MKKLLTKLGKVFVPLILCFALFSTAFMSLDLVDDLQGNARVINYIGIVRGATQRLIKKELNHDPDDALIEYLDNVLSGLTEGSNDLNLIKLDCEKFQLLLSEMNSDWEDIKNEIYKYRNNPNSLILYKQSEAYFELANETVFVAEEYTEQIVHDARNSLMVVNLIFIIMALGIFIFTYYQERRERRLIEAENENRKKSEQLTKQAQELLIPMNEMSESMYVADIDTYNVLFVNETGKKIFKIDGDLDSLKCHKVFYGFDEPCSFCTNKFLKTDETYSWEYTNPITKQHLLLKDRLIDWNGQLARMEIAFDITQAHNEKKELKKKIKRDEIRLACVRELYNNRDIKLAITKVLEYIGELFLAERSYVFRFHDGYYSNYAEWCKTGIEPQIDVLQNIPLNDYVIWMDELQKHKNIVINDIEDIKETFSTGYELLHQQSIKNIVWVPLLREGKVNGLIGLDNQSLDLAEAAVPFLQTIQYFTSLTIQRNESEKALFELSQMDKLTSFYNRNRFIQDISEFKKQEDTVGAIYLDKNGLKEINDCFGHDAGDNLIKQGAQIMRDRSSSQNLYRIGGDEFVIIYTGIGRESFYDEVQLLKNAYQDSQCQIAIGCKWSQDIKNIEDIIKAADELMYKDKKRFYQGHHITSRYRHHNDLLNFLANPDILMEEIRNNHFIVYLQPKINIENFQMAGAEALIRYQDEMGSVILPNKFIPVLEDTYFICKLDYYVFEEVCKNMNRWIDQGHEIFTISSNFSRISFMDDSFVNNIKNISDKYHIPRRFLEIEITENNNYADIDTLTTRIKQIKEAGFKVAIDDFGKESSNLFLLSLVKFDVLKIDKGFVKDITTNENAQTIIGYIAKMCNQMSIQLVAEGVEDKAQLDLLKRFGVKNVQGFLFSKAISISEYESKYMKKDNKLQGS